MDPELLRRYGEELAYLRELGAEFGREFPAVARRLALDATEVQDPYVERLLEGFAFLAARVQIKLDAEHPRFVQHLLEAVCPNFVAPVPSMAVMRLQPDPLDPALARGPVVPRGAALRSLLARGQDTHCEFRSAQAVQLWPLELAAVSLEPAGGERAGLPPAVARQARALLRLRLRALGGARFDRLAIEALPFFVAARDDVAFRLHALVAGAALGSAVTGEGLAGRAGWQDAGSVRPLGFGDDEALLPETSRGFSGHRLLQEFAAMPQRLLFFEIGQLAPRLQRVAAAEADLLVPLARDDAGLETLLDPRSLQLFCTPAINLFHKRFDPVDLTAGAWEHHLVPDRTRPRDHEVHGLATLVGHGNGRRPRQAFEPLYGPPAEAGRAPGHYTLRRELRVQGREAQERTARSGYVGSEVFVSLVDPAHAPYEDDLRQLAPTGWVTNRDLPLLLPTAPREPRADEPPQWRLEAGGPVARVDCLRGPTRPVQRLPRGEIGWSLVNLLSVNHEALLGRAPQQAAAALRALLRLFGPEGDAAWARCCDGVLTLEAAPVTRRLPFGGAPTFGRGIGLRLELDDGAFPGGQAFAFGSVVEQFLARHATINAFTQLTLATPARGELQRWPPRCGTATLL